MKLLIQFAIFFDIPTDGCAGYADKFVSVNIQPLPQLKWQSDEFTLIKVPQVNDIFTLTKIEKNIFYPSTTTLKTKR
jgi:hypothetical protein